MQKEIFAVLTLTHGKMLYRSKLLPSEKKNNKLLLQNVTGVISVVWHTV